MLQHSLPLQQLALVVGVAAVAVPISATRLRIIGRYFINFLFDYVSNFGHVKRAEPSLLRESDSRRRNRRALEPSAHAIVRERSEADTVHAHDKIVGSVRITDKARRLSRATCRSCTRAGRALMHRTPLTRIHVYVSAADRFR